MKTRIGLGVITLIIISTISTAAWAFQEPAAGSFGYEIYEFMDTSVLAGAIGVCVAIGILAYCVYFILRTNIFGAILCAVAAFFVVKLKDIVFSLGIDFPSSTPATNFLPSICLALSVLALVAFSWLLLTVGIPSIEKNA